MESNFEQKQEKHLLYIKNKRYKIEKVAYSGGDWQQAEKEIGIKVKIKFL